MRGHGVSHVKTHSLSVDGMGKGAILAATDLRQRPAGHRERGEGRRRGFTPLPSLVPPTLAAEDISQMSYAVAIHNRDGCTAASMAMDSPSPRYQIAAKATGRMKARSKTTRYPAC